MPDRSVSPATLLAGVVLVAATLVPQRGLAQTGRSAQEEDASQLLLRGIIVEKPDDDGTPPRLVRFELLRADSTVVLTPLGRVDLDVGPLSGFPELPEASDSALAVSLPASSLLTIADEIEGALAIAPPRDQFGFSVEDGRLRVLFERGASLISLVLAALALVAASVGVTTLAFRRRERRRRHASLEARQLQLDAAEAERGRLARDIHDGPLQDLHAARARAEMPPVRSLAAGNGQDELQDAARPRDSAATTVAEDVGAVARELRAIAEGLRPPALGRFGLSAALASHAARMSERHPHVHVRILAGDDAPALSPSAEASLFRIGQEAVTNAIRHGRARTVELEYAVWPSVEAPERVRLAVHDDGVGLPTGLNVDALVASGHFGMAGMAERAMLLGGVFSAVSEGSASRTTVSVEVPWTAVARTDPAPLALFSARS